MKIYYLSPNPILNPDNKRKLESLGYVNYLHVKNANEQEVINKIQDAEILLISPTAVRRLTNHFFISLPKLIHMSLLSAGYDWIDVESAAQNNVSISHCAGVNSVSVAEHTWGLILGLSKRIVEHDRDLHLSGAENSIKYEGIELGGKTIGILGTGSIGTCVARIGKSFGMRVLGHNRHGKRVAGFDQITDLMTLLKQSDIISIHLPLTKETENLLDADKLSYVKKGVIIINTAREQIVNKRAIIEKLKDGKIFGFGIDAEKLESNDPYLQFSNIIVNVHNAFNTREAKQHMQAVAVNNVETFIKGKPINLIKL